MKAAEKKFARKNKSVGGHVRNATNRISRRLETINQFTQEIPSNSEGNDGDVLLYENKSNFNIIEQFLKVQGRWINITTGRPLTDSAVVKKWIKGKTG